MAQGCGPVRRGQGGVRDKVWGEASIRQTGEGTRAAEAELPERSEGRDATESGATRAGGWHGEKPGFLVSAETARCWEGAQQNGSEGLRTHLREKGPADWKTRDREGARYLTGMNSITTVNSEQETAYMAVTG